MPRPSSLLEQVNASLSHLVAETPPKRAMWLMIDYVAISAVGVLGPRLNLRAAILSSRRGAISSVPFFSFSSQSQFRLSRLLEILGNKVKPKPNENPTPRLNFSSIQRASAIQYSTLQATGTVIAKAKDLPLQVLGVRWTTQSSCVGCPSQRWAFLRVRSQRAR